MKTVNLHLSIKVDDTISGREVAGIVKEGLVNLKKTYPTILEGMHTADVWLYHDDDKEQIK